MVPYFPRIIENLKVYLTQEQSDQTMCLQTQSVGEYITKLYFIGLSISILTCVLSESR